MTPLLIAIVAAVMVATSFLSGIFGMAGGMVLVGVLLAILPVPTAMALHAITQMASNGWRALIWRRYVRWRIVVAYVVGCGFAVGLWSVWLFVPTKALALIGLGALPLATRFLPARLRARPEHFGHGVGQGALSMMLMLLTGVAGPQLDQFFLGGSLDRRQIIATKGICQLFGHSLKLVYFGVLIDSAASVEPTLVAVAITASMVGTALSKRVLEAMSDAQYRLWADRIILGVSIYYVAYGAYLLIAPAGT
ncbi:MAG: sulfite exporter TauE/SafE family protein [Alphaproteobacteria bacterium]|nr:sulfite exporter TauE/SafE family protein [Alphaproteobacteria bacterium]